MGAATDQPGRRGLTARGRRTRDNIVQTAATLMQHRGVRATSVDDVLAQCNAGKSQFYQHFTTKDELLKAVIAHHWQQTRAAFELDSQGPDTWPGVRRWVDTVALFQILDEAPERCPLGSLAYELSGASEQVRSQLDKIFTEWAAHLAQSLRRMQRRNEIESGVDTDRLATATLATIQGGLVLSHTHGDLEPLQAALDGAYTLLYSYATERVVRGSTQWPL